MDGALARFGHKCKDVYVRTNDDGGQYAAPLWVGLLADASDVNVCDLSRIRASPQHRE